MSEPTCRHRLFKRCWNLPAGHVCYSGADCLSGVRIYLPGTVFQWCRLLKRCQNLPTGHCVTGLQTVLVVSEPTCLALCCWGAYCLSSVRTYLPGTVLQCCRLFKPCQNLPAGTGCLSGVGTYLLGTVLQGSRLFKQCWNLLPGTGLQAFRLF